MGMILFIVSEVMFFVAFFWAFFHSSFNPSPAIGGVWPPAFIVTLDPWQIPLLNTIILLSSGASVTWAHHSIVLGSKDQAIQALLVTVGLAVIFTGLQAYEYVTAPFSISDSVYGAKCISTTLQESIISDLKLQLGAAGILLNRNNVLLILMGIEIMLLSVDLNLATFSVYLSDSLGQIYFLLGLTVAAAESAIGLAILIAYFKKRKKIAILEINSLKG
eukprot:gene10687-11859_t